MSSSIEVNAEFKVSAFSGTICMALDVFVTDLLCYDLNIRRTGFSGTDSIVAHLVFYIMGRGILLRFLQAIMLATVSAALQHWWSLICISRIWA
ncbi:hypothetical protein DAEQUDRAFT_731328 [Daedalea quercina L-15889]|uniref:Uncharacterized protein n=1 Tax=Daedalea quercina L-15889 TaxID=1314783 RepID=A0A165MCV1_9APHY|nr:hypothetical protein DAEQUDRAFT_731328 [Daedalea quercina L-15889]